MKYNVGKGKSNLSINIIFIIRSSRMITRQTEVINRGLHTFGKFRHALSLCIIMSLITVSLAGCGSNTDFANDASADMNAYVNATEKIYVPTLPEDVEEAEIFVEAIEGIDVTSDSKTTDYLKSHFRLIITHCNNQGGAEKVADMLKERAPFIDYVIMHTSGLSTLYANDGGIIVTY